MEKYEKVKIIYSHLYTSFDNQEMNKETIQEIESDWADVKNDMKALNDSCDGEETFKILCVYDLFDNERYSVRWLEGD